MRIKRIAKRNLRVEYAALANKYTAILEQHQDLYARFVTVTARCNRLERVLFGEPKK